MVLFIGSKDVVVCDLWMNRNQNISSSFVLIYEHLEAISKSQETTSSLPSPIRSECFLDFDGDKNFFSPVLVLCECFFFCFSM